MNRNKEEKESQTLLKRAIAALEQAQGVIEHQAKIISLYEKEINHLKKETKGEEKNIHSRELMFQAFVLQQIRVVEKHKNKRLKLLSDFDALIEANNKLNVYPKKYLLHDGLETQNFRKIITSYTKNYKGQFRNEFGYLIQNFYIRGLLKNHQPNTSKQS